MSTADNNPPTSIHSKRTLKKQQPRTLKTAVSATDLRKLYAEGIQRSGRPLLKKTGNPPLKVHLSKSPVCKQPQQKVRPSIGNPEREQKYIHSKLTHKQQLIKLARQKDIIQHAYFELTHKYFGVLAEMKEQKEKADIEKSLLREQIKELREMVNKNSSKQIHHLFQVPARGAPPSQSKVILEMDEAYQVSNINFLTLPSEVGRKTSESNLSLELQSNEGSQIDIPRSTILT